MLFKLVSFDLDLEYLLIQVHVFNIQLETIEIMKALKHLFELKQKEIT